MRLAVELYGTVVGHVDGPDARTFDFSPSPEGVERFGPNSRVLSVAVPLVAVPARHHAARRRNWFEELLPEGDQLEHMLTQGGIRRGDTLGFLARYGRDIAGAAELWNIDDPSEPRTPSWEAVTDAHIRRLLEDPLGSPLANDPFGGKSSLAGVQPKIVLAHVGGQWGRVIGGFPSTHILKPWLASRPTTIYDEEYGWRIARALGLLDYDSRIEVFDGLPTLVVGRFDRRDGARVHQEDFNQALGASGNQKYQELGGVTSLARVADSITRNGRTSDLRSLARRVVLGAAIGDLDMHTKNLALLHPSSGEVRLAPAYDVVPMAQLPGSDGRLALSIDGVYPHRGLTREHLVAEISSWGVRRAESVVEETLDEIAAVVARETPSPDATETLHDDVVRVTTRLQEGAAAGLA